MDLNLDWAGWWQSLQGMDSSSLWSTLGLPVLLGLGLSACAGLRAWLPLLFVSAFAHSHLLTLNPACEFLGRTDVLFVLVFATLLEVLGDKFPAVDNFLDAMGTFLRPVAGTLASASLFTKMDPMLGCILGLVVGGGTALTVHSGKALNRSLVSSNAMWHGGCGNVAVSFLEDFMALAGSIFTVLSPWLALLVALVLLGIAAVSIYFFVRRGGRMLKWLWHRAQEVCSALAEMLGNKKNKGDSVTVEGQTGPSQ